MDKLAKYIHKQKKKGFDNNTIARHLKGHGWHDSHIRKAFSILRKRNSQKMGWTLRFCKKESLTLLKYIYHKPNLPCLLRKRRVAETFLQNSLERR